MQIVLCCLIWRVAAFVLVHTEKPPGSAERAKGGRIEKSIIQTQNPPEVPHLSCLPVCLNVIIWMSVTPDCWLGPLEGFVCRPIRKLIDPSLHQYLPVHLVNVWFCSGDSRACFWPGMWSCARHLISDESDCYNNYYCINVVIIVLVLM